MWVYDSSSVTSLYPATVIFSGQCVAWPCGGRRARRARAGGGGGVRPVGQAVAGVQDRRRELELARVEAYAAIREQLAGMAGAQEQLQREAANLVKALRAPAVRGRWGEIQLRRVLEVAGMVPYCDFVEQPTVETEDGRLRPDVVVRLPGGKSVVVDAKTPIADRSLRQLRGVGEGPAGSVGESEL